MHEHFIPANDNQQLLFPTLRQKIGRTGEQPGWFAARVVTAGGKIETQVVMMFS